MPPKKKPSQPEAAPADAAPKSAEVFATLHVSNGKSVRLQLTMSGDPMVGLANVLASQFIQTERGFVNTSQIVLAELDGE